MDQAAEGAFGYRIVKNCPWDCPTIPEDLRVHVAHMVETFGSDQFSNVVRDLLGGNERGESAGGSLDGG